MRSVAVLCMNSHNKGDYSLLAPCRSKWALSYCFSYGYKSLNIWTLFHMYLYILLLSARKKFQVSCITSMISNEEGGFLQRILLGLSVFQSTTRGSCIPASRGYGHWSVCGWRFCSSKDEREINIRNWPMTMQWPADAASCPAVLTQLWRTWGNKAFMKPPPSTALCNVTPWYWDTRSWESLLHTLNRCWGFHWPDIQMLISLKHNLRLLWWYWCTFKRFKLCCGVTWLCSHAMVSEEKNYFRSILRKSLWYWIFKEILLNLPLIKKIVSAYSWILS